MCTFVNMVTWLKDAMVTECYLPSTVYTGIRCNIIYSCNQGPPPGGEQGGHSEDIMYGNTVADKVSTVCSLDTRHGTISK